MTDEWTCHICGRTRPDALISVWKTTTEIPGAGGATMTQNVRYCNDTPNCLEGAKTFSFFPKTTQP